MRSDYEKNIKKIYLFKFFKNIGFMGAVLVPFFTQWGGISLTQTLFLQSWCWFWLFIMEVPTGAVADYLGRKTSIAIGCAINVMAALVYGSIPNFYVFMLAEFLWATSFAFLTGATEAFIYDSLKKAKMEKQSKKVFTKAESMKLTGMTLGAPLGSLILMAFGLNAPMLFESIPYFIATVIALTFKEPKTTKKVESKRYLNIMKDGMKFVYRHKIIKILAFDMISISLVSYFIIWFYQPVLQRNGVPIEYFGTVHMLLVLAQIGIINSYPKMDNLFRSRKRVLSLGAVITSLMFIVMALSSNAILSLVAILVAAGFGLSRRVLFSTYFNKYIKSGERATVLSTISMLRRFGNVIVNPIVGWLADWSLTNTLLIIGAFGIISSILSGVSEEMLADKAKT